MGKFFITILFGLLFGIFQKLSDSQNEHHLNSSKGKYFVFALLAGIFGILLSLQSQWLTIQISGLAIYWLIKKKIDAPNHIISLAVYCTGLLLFSSIELGDLKWISLITASYLFIYEVKHRINHRLSKLHIIVLPILLTILSKDIYVLVGNGSSILGVLLTKSILKNYHPRYQN